MLLRGLFTALVTPFHKNGELDEEGLKANLHHQLNSGVDGVVVLGTTGESPTLSDQERTRLIKCVVKELKGRIPVMVGTGTNSTQKSIHQTMEAEKLGADAVLVMTPYYNKPTQEGIFRHFEALAKAATIPICIYNIPHRTGQNIQTDTLMRISQYKRVIGVKEASGNISQICDVLEFARSQKGYSLMSGDDFLTLPVCSMGGQGVISVLSNLIPGKMKEFVAACLAKDFTKAEELHFQFLPLFKTIFIETNPIPIKAAMQHFNMPSGPCRLPLCELSSNASEQLQAVLKAIPHSWLAHHG